MENYICCPVCDSIRIRERHIGKRQELLLVAYQAHKLERLSALLFLL
ncbi:TPA: hypothetical protein ACH91Y_003052 [Escherichia coli]|nr:hypothetical protein [Escherichia coli]